MRMFSYGYLNSYFQTGLKNLLDLAVLERSENNKSIWPQYPKVDEIPFDFIRRRMSVVVQKEAKDQLASFDKGAVEEIMPYAALPGQMMACSPLTEGIKHQAKLGDALNKDGFRVLGVAL